MGFLAKASIGSIVQRQDTLSPEELKAIQEVTRLLSQVEAEAKARAIKQLELTNEYRLVGAGISKHWLYKNELIWDLRFERHIENNLDPYYKNVKQIGRASCRETVYI